MDNVLKEFASEAEKAFKEDIDFSDEGELAKTCKKVYQKLDNYRLGPRALSLLLAFAFDEEKRKKMSSDLKSVIRKHT